MRYCTVCSGIECASVALQGLGWEPVFFSEIEPFPCELLGYRYPGVPNLGDMTKIRYDKDKDEVTNGTISIPMNGEKIDVLAGGTPCFEAGTMVLTLQGYVPIEDIKVGDHVVTHLGNVAKVTAVGQKKAKTGKVKIAGRAPIGVTAEHPFWAVPVGIDHSRKSPTYAKTIQKGEYRFAPVSKAVGMYAGRVPDCAYDQAFLIEPLSEWQTCLAGWYVGDGYVRRSAGKSKLSVVIALVAPEKIRKFEERFKGKFNYSVSADGKITICNTNLARMFLDSFGEHSTGKRIPFWLYSSKYKESFLEGYEATDGYRVSPNVVKYTTVSKALAYGIADLYRTACVSFCEVPPKTIIEGREVNQHNQYQVGFYKNAKCVRHFEDRFASRIMSYEDGAIGIVFNITVEGDHSYIVNGIAVHNCQDVSIAGRRAGMAQWSGTRSSLAFHFVRLADELRPK